MRVRVATILDVAAERAAAAVKTPALLLHVAAPLLSFRSLEPGGFPEVWVEGPHQVSMAAFGIVPLGRQTIGIELHEDGPDVWRVRDKGSGQLVRVWDHWITITRRADGACDYEDVVDVEAGVLTPAIWLYAQIFYRWRQSRWRGLIRAGRL
jgi:hypothetical protein